MCRMPVGRGQAHAFAVVRSHFLSRAGPAHVFRAGSPFACEKGGQGEFAASRLSSSMRWKDVFGSHGPGCPRCRSRRQAFKMMQGPAMADAGLARTLGAQASGRRPERGTESCRPSWRMPDSATGTPPPIRWRPHRGGLPGSEPGPSLTGHPPGTCVGESSGCPTCRAPWPRASTHGRARPGSTASAPAADAARCSRYSRYG